ncbi:MAG: DUF4167 domain-containing protein [Alphaproteobacteria bacterium]|nr:DUF4167 domain-containing protein [Alphaproteobacteria bacterium]
MRHQGGGSGNVPLNRNHVFDSQGPDLRIRGTSQQLFEKYLQLGRDATSSGDRVMAESYFQYAEHYFRIVTAMNQAAQQQGQPQGQGQGGGQPHRRHHSEMQDSEAPDEAEVQPMHQEGAAVEIREIPITGAPPEQDRA